MMEHVKYIFKKLWPLILLLIISAIVVITGKSGSFLLDFLHSFFFFSVYVLGQGIIAHFVGEALPRRFNYESGFFSCKA